MEADSRGSTAPHGRLTDLRLPPHSHQFWRRDTRHHCNSGLIIVSLRALSIAKYLFLKSDTSSVTPMSSSRFLLRHKIAYCSLSIIPSFNETWRLYYYLPTLFPPMLIERGFPFRDSHPLAIDYPLCPRSTYYLHT